MKHIVMLMLATTLAWPAVVSAQEKGAWGLTSRGLRLGFGASRAQGRGAVEYQPGFAFQASLFSSFGWKKRLSLQPELSFLARSLEARDELELMGVPTGLFRDTRWELSEGQGALLLKLGKPWTSQKGRGRLLYALAGPAWAYHFEGKRVIRLDSPGSIPKSDAWQKEDEIHLAWVAAVGLELTRPNGRGFSLEGRWEQRDRGLSTHLGDRLQLRIWSVQLGLLF